MHSARRLTLESSLTITERERNMPSKLESKLEKLRRYHRQNVFNEGADGDRHARALRRLGRTKTMSALVAKVRADAEQRASEKLLRLNA